MDTENDVNKKPPKTKKAPNSPAPSAAAEVHTPRAAPASSARPVPVQVPIASINLFTKGTFATTGKVTKAHDKVMTTNTGGTLYFFFVLTDNEVCKTICTHSPDTTGFYQMLGLERSRCNGCESGQDRYSCPHR